MSDFVRNMMIEQRKRTVGGLMQYMEKNIYPRLHPSERDALRTKVLETVGAYHDVCLDMLKASVNDGSIVNEQAVLAMAELHADVRALRKDLRNGHQ